MSKKILIGVLGACLAIYPVMGTFMPVVHAKVTREKGRGTSQKVMKDEVMHVSSYAQLKNILENDSSLSVQHIILDSDIGVSGEGGENNDINIKGNQRQVIIDGGEKKHEIHFSTQSSNNNDNDIELEGNGQKVTFKNITFVNTDNFGAVWSNKEGQVHFQDVEIKTGKKFVYGGSNLSVHLKGQIKVKTEEKSIDLQHGSLTADSGADIDIFSKNSHAIEVCNFVAEEQASIKAKNEGSHNQAVFSLVNNGTAHFKKGSSVDFSIEAGNSLAIGSYGLGSFYIEEAPIATWEKLQVDSEKPTYFYPSTEANFVLEGWGSYTRSEGRSTPPEFMNRFSGAHGGQKPGSADNTGRFATGKFASQSIGETTIDELTTKSTQATGKAEPESNMTIKAGGQTIATGKAKADGTYAIDIPKQPAGTKVTAQAELNSVFSNIAKTTVKQALDGTITPNEYKLGQDYITGSYTGDVKQIELWVDDHFVSRGGTIANGQFKYYVDSGKIKQGSKVELHAYSGPLADKDRMKLDSKSVSIASPTGTITPDKYKLGESYITGSYTGDVKQIELWVDDHLVSRGGNISKGKFKYYVDPGKIKQGSKVELRAYSAPAGDSSRVQLDSKSVSITSPTGTIKPNEYKLGQSYITGSYTGDVAQIELWIDDDFVSRGGTFTNGQFRYYVDSRKIKQGSKVELRAYSAPLEDGSRVKVDTKDVVVGQ